MTRRSEGCEFDPRGGLVFCPMPFLFVSLFTRVGVADSDDSPAWQGDKKPKAIVRSCWTM